MVADITFSGDPAVKALALGRMRAHIEAGTFALYPPWGGGKGNAVDAAVEATDDNLAYAQQFGYPVALTTAVEAIVNGFQTLSAGQDFATAWLDRTPVGADLSCVVAQILVFVLDQPDIVQLTSHCSELERCRLAVSALHMRAIAGDEPDRKEWRSARLAAVAASDTATGRSLVQKAGMIVEAAAWPSTMRSVLHDTLCAWGRLEVGVRLQAIGWTDSDEDRVFNMRERAEEELRMADLSGLDRVLALLDADDAELARRFRQRLDVFGQLGEVYRIAGWKLLDLFEQAPIPALRNGSA